MNNYEQNQIETREMWLFYWDVWNGDKKITNVYEYAVYHHVHHLRYWERFEPINLLKRK